MRGDEEMVRFCIGIGIGIGGVGGLCWRCLAESVKLVKAISLRSSGDRSGLFKHCIISTLNSSD